MNKELYLCVLSLLQYLVGIFLTVRIEVKMVLVITFRVLIFYSCLFDLIYCSFYLLNGVCWFVVFNFLNH